VRTLRAGGSEWGMTRYSGRSDSPDVWHNGFDAAGEVGTAIGAPGAGTATTGTDSKSGLDVKVDLGNGYSASFSHLSDVPGVFKTCDGTIDHSIRATVNAGDVVGFLGQTGNSDISGREPHVHIVTKHGSGDYNPRDFYAPAGGAGSCQ
jgi:murein DD-endopeptidase MepM/ murein hydrolase activator NlpD